MQINLPYKIRAAIYIIVVLGTSIIVPLNVAHIVSDVLFQVWTSVSGAASLLAAFNTGPSAGEFEE